MKLHDSRQLGPLVFRDPLLLCSALYFLLYFDASGFLAAGVGWRRSCTSAGTFWCIVCFCAAFRSLR